MGSKLYGPTTVGPFSKVGGEVSNSVIFGYSNKGHDGFMGNSVIGEWCNFGADSNISNLKNIFNSQLYGANYTDELLAYVSGMFSKNVKLYAYPYLNKKENKIVTTENMPVSEEARPLFQFLTHNQYIIDIENYDERFVKTV